MQQPEPCKNILAEVKSRQSFMDMLCSSASADYSSRGGKVFCGKGCSSCCTLAVNCTAPEALLIASSLDKGQQEKLTGYVDNLKGRVAGISDLKGYLRMHRIELAGCPFLDDTICGIYSTRPISCRSLLSTKESFWCGVDFSELPSADKLAFVESLDREDVAFPMHYLASTRDAGQKLEREASMQMMKEFGFSLYGSMPVLIHLFREFALLESIGKGADEVLELVASAGFDSQFILQVETL